MIHLILFGLLIIFSLLAVELDNLTYSIISLAIVGVVLGIIFFTLGAVYVSMLQILIYGGAITILFFTLVSLTEEKGKPRILAPMIKGLEVPGIVLLIVLFCLFLGLLTFQSVLGGTYIPIPEITENFSVWIWNYRLTDTITQAFVMFSALIGILVIWWSK